MKLSSAPPPTFPAVRLPYLVVDQRCLWCASQLRLLSSPPETVSNLWYCCTPCVALPHCHTLLRCSLVSTVARCVSRCYALLRCSPVSAVDLPESCSLSPVSAPLSLLLDQSHNCNFLFPSRAALQGARLCVSKLRTAPLSTGSSDREFPNRVPAFPLAIGLMCRAVVQPRTLKETKLQDLLTPRQNRLNIFIQLDPHT